MRLFVRALLLLILSAGAAQAADYTWSINGNYFDTSPGASCEKQFQNFQGPGGSWVYKSGSASVTFVAKNQYNCGGGVYTLDWAGESKTYEDNRFQVTRDGDACAAGSVENDKGLCEVQSKCTALKDQNFAWGFKTAVGYVTNGGKHGVTEHVNKDGCEATTGSFQCDAASDGSDYGYCKGVATYTGLNATAGDANVGATTMGTDPNKDSNTNCGTGYTWSGSTCVKNPETTPDPGTGGGTGGGEGTGDGTGTGGSTGGGSTGGGSTGGGTGGDGTGGTGTGDGTGTGTTPGGDDDKDDDTPDKSTVAGEACTASLACSGDAIQCAILRQAREQKCQTAEWNDYSKAKDTINSAVAGKEYQLGESKSDVSTGFDTGTRFLSASCPAPKSWHSDSFGRTFQISYQPACDYASAISALVLAMASLFFIVYVGRGFGGD